MAIYVRSQKENLFPWPKPKGINWRGHLFHRTTVEPAKPKIPAKTKK